MPFLPVLLTKTSAFALGLIGRGGSLPGELALRVDPQIFDQLTFDGPVILVTGTNGKTSTANMIADAFQHAGKKVVTNRKGDNLREGIAAALLKNASTSGHVKADAVVLEVDELNIRHILPHLPVAALVVNNFFRDQLDRAREMEQLIESIESVLPGFAGKLILNGNDPNVIRLKDKAPNAQAIYFGLAENAASVKTTGEASEGKFCPRCGSRLEYDYYQYSHIGKFHCTHCDYQTPALDIELTDIDLENGSFSEAGHAYKNPYEGMYSLYNAAALLAAAKTFGLPESAVEETFAHAPQPAGRNEHFQCGDKSVRLNLVKNPTGANEVMKVIEKDPTEKSVVIVLNDNEQDGTDVSWIYDTHFERLMNEKTASFWCTGTRGYDMALRLKYEGWSGPLQVVRDTEAALAEALKEGSNVYVIATYTALLPARNEIKKVCA